MAETVKGAVISLDKPPLAACAVNLSCMWLSFQGEALTADERSRYCQLLSQLHADVKEWKQTVGLPSLSHTSTRAYSIWAVCVAVLACMLLLE